MELKKVMEERRSIRKFKTDSVNDEDLREILEAARLAPSGTNLQPWRFVVIKSEKIKEKLKAHTLNFVTQAPVIIACCADLSAYAKTKERVEELANTGAFVGTELESGLSADYKRPSMTAEAIAAYSSLNVAIAVEHMILRAHDLGLGSCWIMMFNQGEVKQILELEDNIHIVALLPLGYPDQNPSMRPRLPMTELILKEI